MIRRVESKNEIGKGKGHGIQFQSTHSSTLLNIYLLSAYNMTGKGSERDRLSFCPCGV